MNAFFIMGPLLVAVIFWASWLEWIPRLVAVPLCTITGFFAGALSHRLPRRRRVCEACSLIHRRQIATHVLANGHEVCEQHFHLAQTWLAVASTIGKEACQ